MNRHKLIILICLALIFVFTSESYSVTEAGQILAVKKKVYLIRDKQKSNAVPQMLLLLKDTVETDRKSRTKLFFKDDSILNLGELSRVVVEEYVYSPEKQRSKSIYRLIDGSLKVVVGRSDLEIHTPTAVAAARGTKFIIWAEGRDNFTKSCAMVLEGEVILKSIKEDVSDTVTLSGGTMSCVPMGGPPGGIEPVGPAEAKRFTSKAMVVGTATDDQTEGEEESLAIEGSMMMGAPPVALEPAGTRTTSVTIDIILP